MSTLLFLALAFVVGMIACDAANGLWIAHLIGRSRGFGAAARRSFSVLVALAALTVAGIGIVRLELPRADGWFGQRGLWFSAFMSLAILVGYVLLRRKQSNRVIGSAREFADWAPHPRRRITRRDEAKPSAARAFARSGRVRLPT